MIDEDYEEIEREAEYKILNAEYDRYYARVQKKGERKRADVILQYLLKETEKGLKSKFFEDLDSVFIGEYLMDRLEKNALHKDVTEFVFHICELIFENEILFKKLEINEPPDLELDYDMIASYFLREYQPRIISLYLDQLKYEIKRLKIEIKNTADDPENQEFCRNIILNLKKYIQANRQPLTKIYSSQSFFNTKYKGTQ
jgi:hypothetical protein